MGRKPRVDRSSEEKWQIVQEGIKWQSLGYVVGLPDVSPRFEIQGERFTTQEIIQLHQEDKLTNSGLSEIIRTRRMAAASKVAGPQISSNKG